MWTKLLNQLGDGAKGQGALRSRLERDPYYRFQSFDEVRLAAQMGIGIDVNRAETDDWLRLPGVSIHQAKTLVALRKAGVQFHSLDDVAAALSLSVQRLQPLAPILQFCYYDPASPGTIQLVNLNSASAEMLVRIPAMDLYLARAIVQNRQRYGVYRNLAELQQRLQLSPRLTEALMHYVCF